jgi:hypothetical protein
MLPAIELDALIPADQLSLLVLRTRLFDVAPVAPMVTLPAVVSEDVVVIEPEVLMTVAPPMREVPCMVPAVMMALSRVLLVRVSAPSRTTMIPVDGYVAELFTPVPPLDEPRIPDTASDTARLIGPNSGPLVPTLNT